MIISMTLYTYYRLYTSAVKEESCGLGGTGAIEKNHYIVHHTLTQAMLHNTMLFGSCGNGLQYQKYKPRLGGDLHTIGYYYHCYLQLSHGS